MNYFWKYIFWWSSTKTGVGWTFGGVMSKNYPEAAETPIFCYYENIWILKTWQLHITHKWNLAQICTTSKPFACQKQKINENVFYIVREIIFPVKTNVISNTTSYPSTVYVPIISNYVVTVYSDLRIINCIT